MYISGGSPTVINCAFIGNVVQPFFGLDGGGGIHNGSGSGLTITNCIFSGNSVGFGVGGGIKTGSNSTPIITNCAFSFNDAANGGAIYGGSPTVTNCIFWANIGGEIVDSSATVSFSDVQGGWPGTGNIDADPLFVDADGPDDTVGTEDDDLRLLPGSPCIDAADNTAVTDDIMADLDGDPRFVDDPSTPDTGQGDCPIVDMGAYESQEGEGTVCCPADLDSDGIVGAADLAQLLGAWGLNPDHPADLNDDDVVNATDLAQLLGTWGACP